MKLENKFRLQFTTALKGFFGSKIYIQKNHGGPMSAGLPDLYIREKSHKEVALELKAMVSPEPFNWHDNPTPLQRSVLMDMAMAGLPIGVLLYIKETERLHAFHGKLLVNIFTEVRKRTVEGGPPLRWDPRGSSLWLAQMDVNEEHQSIPWRGHPDDLLDLTRVTWGLT